MTRLVVSALAFAVALAPTGPARAGDPSRVWKTLETEHFVVHYYQPLDPVGRRIAVVAERAHRTLAPAFDWTPSEKTHIVVVDDTDSSNGFANVLPRNTIRLFANAPRELSSLGDHDDWLYSLVAHEYTHIIHLDSIGGVARVYNKVFGKTWSPNQISPRWLIEGIATYEESKRSAGGRTRFSLFDTELRMATLRGDERTLDEITHGPRAHPHGNAAYLYGSHFLRYVFDRYGDDTLRQLSWDYGTNPVPWGLNQSIRRAVGKTFIELYDEWADYRRSKYAMQREAVDRAGAREGRRLTFSGESNSEARYTRDGSRIVWRMSDGLSRSRFVSMAADSNVGHLDTYMTVERAGSFDLLADGSMVVEQTRTRNEIESQDIHIYGRDGSVQQLTTLMRANDPAVSPDQRTIAFVTSGNSRRVLRVMPLREEAPTKVVWRGGQWEQAFAPAWSPDGRSIAFSVWRDGGYKDIMVVRPATGRAVAITHDRAQEGKPTFSPDGRYLLFASDRTGIFNIYAHELATGKLYQVTNVLGCAIDPAVSPDGKKLVYTGFDAGHELAGNELYEIPLDPAQWVEAPLYIDDRPDPTRIRDSEVAVTAPRDYRALETLAPRAYTLSLAANSFGQTVQVSTSGSDMIGRHNYQLAVGIGLEKTDVSVGGSYSYNYLWPSIRIAANRNAAERGGFRIDGESTQFVEESIGATLAVGLPVLRDPRSSSTLSIDYDFDHLRNVEDDFDGYDPNDIVPRYPETDVTLSAVALRWTFSDSRGFTHTLGPQEGNNLSLSLRVDHPAIGSDFHGATLDYRWNWYRKLPWGVTPVLAVRLGGGLRSTDRSRTGVFSLGGAPEQNVVSAIVDNLRAGSTGFLRGYEARAFTGDQFHLLNLEYRQELFNIERGFATLPFFVRRVHVAGLFDAGDAFDGEIDLGRFKTSVGASLRTDFVLGYFFPGSVDVGYARGLSAAGIHEVWLLLTGTL